MSSVPVARRNLFHNRRRLAAALAGVIFAVVLVNMEVGILLGFIANSTSFIDRMPADVWIMARGTPNFDMCQPIAEPTLQRVRAVGGVAWAEKMLVEWSTWKTADGTEEEIEVVGLPPGGNLAVPWTPDPPEASRLLEPRGVIVDRGEQARLGVRGVGDNAEMSGRRVRVVGFTTGLRSFTTTPYAIMRHADAAASSAAAADSTSYILVKAAQGISPAQMRDRLRRELGNLDVLTTDEWRRRTQGYWLFTTGVGTAFLMAALLGFMVGGAVVGQVLYAMVMEQRAEFGVLKAMGAGRGFLGRVVLGQAALIGTIGYVAGMLATVLVFFLMRSTGTPMILTGELTAGCFGAVVVVCLVAAVLPMAKMIRLEPALVFRG